MKKKGKHFVEIEACSVNNNANVIGDKKKGTQVSLEGNLYNKECMESDKISVFKEWLLTKYMM